MRIDTLYETFMAADSIEELGVPSLTTLSDYRAVMFAVQELQEKGYTEFTSQAAYNYFIKHGFIPTDAGIGWEVVG